MSVTPLACCLSVSTLTNIMFFSSLALCSALGALRSGALSFSSLSHTHATLSLSAYLSACLSVCLSLYLFVSVCLCRGGSHARSKWSWRAWRCVCVCAASSNTQRNNTTQQHYTPRIRTPSHTHHTEPQSSETTSTTTPHPYHKRSTSFVSCGFWLIDWSTDADDV